MSRDAVDGGADIRFHRGREPLTARVTSVMPNR
jgi:hypothetical protein